MDIKHPDPDRLLALIEQARADMMRTFDNLAAAVREAAPPAAPASPHKRRTLYRGGSITPTDIDRAKAQAALRRMGIKP